MDYLKKHKLVFATIAIQAIALPLVILVARQPQEVRTRAQEPNTNNLPTPLENSSPQASNSSNQNFE